MLSAVGRQSSWDPLTSLDEASVQIIGQWSWLNEATVPEEWTDYDAEFNTILETGYQARQDKVAFAEYEVDLFNMEQRNRWTQNVRPVRRTRANDDSGGTNDLADIKKLPSIDTNIKDYSADQWAKCVESCGQFIWKKPETVEGIARGRRGNVFGPKKKFIR
eukprot:SAG22_NODE_2625_length_2362_cov_10.263809_2_plen_161_part_01